MLYASAYPFCPITETLENFQALAIAPEVMADVLYNNAHAILARIGALQTETG
jgi:predicted TIM-barrel fold metal-dependent hydrolase